MIKNYAEFNRLLNIASHFRTLKSGKRVPVKGHRRTYERLKAALQDLNNQPDARKKEYGYLFNPKNGIVSQRISGKKRQLSFDQLLKSDIEDVKANRYFIHNHPDKTSLSPEDLLVSEKGPVFAINTNGSIFRGRLLNNDPNYKQLIADLSRSMRRELGIKTYDELLNNKGKNPITKFARRLMYLLNPNKQFKPSDVNFLLTHGVNRALHKNGLIHYRANLSSPDLILYGRYKNKLDPYFDDYVKGLVSNLEPYEIPSWITDIL